jgi:hypothetical protein
MSKVPVDRATPQITEPMATPEEMVSTGNDTINKIKASSNYANAPEVQNAVTAWQTTVSALDTNNKAKEQARAQLDQAETAEPALVRRYHVRRNGVLTAIAAFADGSKQIVQSFGTAVGERKPAPVATVPANVRPMIRKRLGVASVRWDPTPGASGYLLQHCTNPADATTYAAPISLTQARYHLTGQTPGATVYFRVLACDPSLPNGQSAYTAWLAVLVGV